MPDLCDQIRVRLDDEIDIRLSPQPYAAALHAVTGLHQPWRIYQPCGHDHDTESASVVYVDDVGLVCADGLAYTICTACCANGAGQTERCADDHHRGACWPCPTIRAVADALGIKETQ
ncbi:MAG TPA: hypothetical protein VIS06_17305 [Mycobacteriales bacterium]